MIICTFFKPLFDFRSLFIWFSEWMDYYVIATASMPLVYGVEP